METATYRIFMGKALDSAQVDKSIVKSDGKIKRIIGVFSG
jgi:hypothetical protein